MYFGCARGGNPCCESAWYDPDDATFGWLPFLTVPESEGYQWISLDSLLLELPSNSTI